VVSVDKTTRRHPPNAAVYRKKEYETHPPKPCFQKGNGGFDDDISNVNEHERQLMFSSTQVAEQPPRSYAVTPKYIKHTASPRLM